MDRRRRNRVPAAEPVGHHQPLVAELPPQQVRDDGFALAGPLAVDGLDEGVTAIAVVRRRAVYPLHTLPLHHAES